MHGAERDLCNEETQRERRIEIIVCVQHQEASRIPDDQLLLSHITCVPLSPNYLFNGCYFYVIEITLDYYIGEHVLA